MRLGGDIRTFGQRLSREARVFGNRISDHPFRKIHNTLHTVSGVLDAASLAYPIVKPFALGSHVLEGVTGALKGVTFTDGSHNQRQQKPMLER